MPVDKGVPRDDIVAIEHAHGKPLVTLFVTRSSVPGEAGQHQSRRSLDAETGKNTSSETEPMSKLLRVIEELRAILKDEKQLARLTDPELIQLRCLLDEQRSVLWRIEQEKLKNTGSS